MNTSTDAPLRLDFDIGTRAVNTPLDGVPLGLCTYSMLHPPHVKGVYTGMSTPMYK